MRRRAILIEAVEGDLPKCRGTWFDDERNLAEEYFLDKYGDPTRKTISVRRGVRMITKGTLFWMGDYSQRFLKRLNFRLHDEDKDMMTSDMFSIDGYIRGDVFIIKVEFGILRDVTDDELMLVYRATHHDMRQAGE